MTAHDSEASTPTKISSWERAVDAPLLVLALATIPLIVLEDVGQGPLALAAGIANWVIWALFAVDLSVRVWLVGSRRMRYLARHWYDVGIVVLSVVPYFLPLRALRSARALRALRAARVLAYSARFWHVAIRLWGSLTGRVLVVLIPAIVAAGSAGVWLVERHSNDNIDDYGDAAWWAITTVTTVGYGDIAPVTVEGRFIAAVLMITGIAAFGLVTANVAAAMTARREPEQDINSRLDELLAAVDELRQQQAQQR